MDKFKLLFYGTVLLLVSTVWGSARTSKSVEVRVKEATFENGNLRIGWSIHNRSSRRVFLYSPFLYGPAAESHIEKTSDTLIVRTSPSSKSSVGVNAYPPATFVELQPGQQLEGIFVDRGMNHFDRVRRIIYCVAFNYDVEAVKTELRKVIKEGLTHPANPIVDWQRISSSLPFRTS